VPSGPLVWLFCSGALIAAGLVRDLLRNWLRVRGDGPALWAFGLSSQPSPKIPPWLFGAGQARLMLPLIAPPTRASARGGGDEYPQTLSGAAALQQLPVHSSR